VAVAAGPEDRHHRLFRVQADVASLILIAGLIAFPATAGDLVPFRALIQTVPLPVGSCGIGCLELDISGTGLATHMGGTEMHGPSQVDVILREQTGTSTLTAAHGDTLEIAFAGTVEFESPDPTGPVSFEGTWEVTGGTGRFEDSVGGGTYGGTAEGPAGALLLVGRVSRPGRE
jgi:hypothetical protein